MPYPPRPVCRSARRGARTHAYRAEVTAEGPVNGATVAVLLGSRTLPNRRLALRWLCGQARRIADGLDPDPAVSAWAADGVLASVPGQWTDAPTELRLWCGSEVRQEEAADRLAEGLPFQLTAADHTGAYTLRAWPAGVIAPRPGALPPVYLGWAHGNPSWPSWLSEHHPGPSAPHRVPGSPAHLG
ncbi:hypothetical protein CUT44_32390 [Streptomyces carminius]|uniref:Uncharacterized protein n=1 Tax=Streptomyces carminius TaxID=2665496 RepID=A0A2M8LPM7_9ACTN|nr:hypothetical protein [Streptomyces carminius]PJE93890.1 hypothetical protein CUT44_32390 [Streptomyces carminius]